MNNAIERQREYYARTAVDYDAAHSLEPEHLRAVELLAGAIRNNGWHSVLEVGCGTGRVARELLRIAPEVIWRGLDPSVELLSRLEAPLSEAAVVADGNRLPFPNESFDVVYAFAVLHHVPHPECVIDEMLRVARRAVFISDNNNFGQGRRGVRLMKRVIRRMGLWPIADWVNTRGKGYHYSDGDGVFYSFSVFTHLSRMRRKTRRVDIVGLNGELDPYRNAGTVALLAHK